MIALLALCSPAWAAQLVLDADTRELQHGQVVTLHLTVVDAVPSGPPRIPSSRGLNFDYRGQRHSTTIINYQTTRTVTYSYSMAATSPGTWEVGPVELAVGGEALKSNSLTIEVLERDAGSDGEGVSATLGVDDIWVGQTVVYHLEFRTPKQVTDLRWTPPEFEGFVPEQTAGENQREYSLRENGQETTVIELDMPLVATSPGARSVAPAVLQAQHRVRRKGRRRTPFESLTQTESEIYTTEPIPAAVRPLPESGRGDDWSGLVGQFRLRAELSEAGIAVGESATLTVRVVGDGTLSGFALPEMSADGFRAYDDQAELSGRVEGGKFLSEGIFRRAIVPDKPGDITVPAVRLQIFNPDSGAYEIIATQPITLRVDEGEERTTVTSYAEVSDTRQDVVDLDADILPIHAHARLRSQVFEPFTPGVILPTALPVLALMGFALRDVAANRRESPVDRRKALKARLASLKPGGADPGELESVFREALGILIGCPAGAVDRERIGALDAETYGDLGGESLLLYGELEEVRYGGGDVSGALAERVLALARKLLEAA